MVGGQSLSPYDAAMTIAETFGLDKNLINKTTRDEFFKDRAPRPFNLALKNDKIEKLGITMRRFEDALQEMRNEK